MDIIPIEDTNYWGIEGDIYTTEKCQEKRSLIWDSNWDNLYELNSLPKNSVVLDVGAFIGDSTRFFLDKGFQVYAFEPYEDAFCCLVHNCPEAHCYNVALGQRDFCYELGWLKGTGNPGGRFVKFSKTGKPFVSVDEFVSTHLISRVDILKIDVEGFEPFVLEGAIQCLKNYRPIIMVEVNPYGLSLNGKTIDDITMYLRDYTCREFFRYQNDNWDFICVPR
jgi:FkbM family methyltransferase